jgi:hypothetical protein
MVAVAGSRILAGASLAPLVLFRTRYQPAKLRSVGVVTVWTEDYALSQTSALEMLVDKCGD